MRKLMRVVALGCLALGSTSVRNLSPCETTIGSYCLGGGYLTCTYADGTPETLICFNHSWHVA